METITHKHIMKLGFSKTASKLIIREAKSIAVEQFYTSHLDNNAVKLRKSPFDNRRLDLAPKVIVEELLGFPITDERKENR